MFFATPGFLTPPSSAPSYNFDNALLTDGVDDYATPTLPITTTSGEFVLSFWFRSTLSGGGASTTFVATQSTESDLIMMANLDRVRIKLDGTSYDYNYSWSNDSNWHHYYWYRNSSGALYVCIDGGSANLLSSGASGGITFDYLFRRGTSNTLNLNGTIDDFYLATTAGSAAKAASVYNSGNGANPQTVHSDNGVVFYQFNESSGITAADSSGNGNDLTLSNFSGAYFLPHSYDTDASVYLATAGITDTAEQAAVNQLVKDLKGTGSTTNNTDVWSDSDVLSPISPTSLEAARYNLKNPTLYKVGWFNSPTHSSSGVVGNGTTQYGDMGWNPSTDGTQNDAGLTIAINTNVTSNYVDSGVRNGTTSLVQLNSYFSANAQGIVNADAVGFTSAANANTIGIYTAVRRSSTDTELYKDGVSIDSKPADTSVAPPNGNVFIMARNLVGTGAENFSTRRFSFAAIHKGLTDNQAKDLYDAITTYNTTLSR